MDKRNWKVLFSDYSGMEKKAVELVSTEMGRFLNRDKGVYRIHVFACEQSVTLPTDCNAVVIGLYDTNELVRKFIKKDEIPESGFVVKVMDNPENEALKLAVITADTQAGVFYGATDFVDDYFPDAADFHGGLKMVEDIFEQEKMPDYYHASAPKFKTRSIFSWGHPLNDYRKYIENMARLKMNQLILWNDHVPLNANDVVDYAHEYGIEVIWGYSWGWRKSCADEEYLKEIMSDIPALKKRVLDEYEEKYSHIKGDGIYFQSFTELRKHEVGGKVVAETVTNFVNETADALLKKYPELKIQFGLHATSVRDKMEYLAKVDGRIEILWEDCGSFPYQYFSFVDSEEEFIETQNFTEEMINLREVNPIGLVYKGQMTMDWRKFVNQRGRYILGKEHEEIIQNDIEIMRPIWRNFQADWVRYGKYAHRMSNFILEKTGGDVNMNLAGTLSGGIWMPFAVTAQLFWDCTEDFDQLLHRVMKRRYVKMA